MAKAEQHTIPSVSATSGGPYDEFSASLEDISKILQEYDDDSAQSHINGDLGE